MNEWKAKVFAEFDVWIATIDSTCKLPVQETFEHKLWSLDTVNFGVLCTVKSTIYLLVQKSRVQITSL